MPTPWKYEPTTELPEGVAAMLLDNGQRVVVKVNATMPCSDVTEAVDRLVAEYRATVCEWDRVEAIAS